MKSKYKFLVAAVLGSTMLSSCYDLERYPDYSVSAGTFFQTEAHAKQAMMGTYRTLQMDYVYGLYFGYDVLGGVSMGYDNPSFFNIAKGNVAVNTAYFSNKWAQLYEGIARCNNVLQNIDRCDMTDQLKTQYKAEARFLRGLFYFNLLDFYGGVPIYDESVVVAESFSEMLEPRSTADQVRSFIIADLDAAAAALPDAWDAANAGRATADAAVALKGKVLLYAGKYQEASSCFAKVIDGGRHQLYNDYAGLFTPGGDESSEMIFAVQNLGGVGQDIGMPMCFYLGSRASFGSCWNNVMPATSFVESFEYKDGRPFDWDELYPNYTKDNKVKQEVMCSTIKSGGKAVDKYTTHKQELLDMYAERDPRMNASVILPYTNYNGWVANAPHMHEFALALGSVAINANGDLIQPNGNRRFYLWRKFVPEADMNGAINNRAHTPINWPIIRYADVLLMQAECLNETGNQSGAVDLINQVRARVGMPGLNSGPDNLKATSKDEVFNRIRLERSWELCCEGHSYGDMKRWKLLTTLNGKKEIDIIGYRTEFTRAVQERDYLWPIPLGEIDKNAALTQNPGWE